MSAHTDASTTEHKEQDVSEKYNGWTNYETWQVHLWLSNDEYWYGQARSVARPGEWSDRAAEQAMRDLAEECAYTPFGVDVEAGEGIPASLGSDIITAALGRVDWAEIVAAFRED